MLNQDGSKPFAGQGHFEKGLKLVSYLVSQDSVNRPQLMASGPPGGTGGPAASPAPPPTSRGQGPAPGPPVPPPMGDWRLWGRQRSRGVAQMTSAQVGRDLFLE